MNDDLKVNKVIIFCLFAYTFILAVNLYSSTFSFDWDEWSILLGLSSNSFFNWLIQLHMGHLFPVGKILYFIEIKFFGTNYGYYLIVNAILQSFIVLLLYKLLRCLGGEKIPSILISIL